MRELRVSLDLQRATVDQQQTIITQLQTELSDMKLSQTLMSREIHMLKVRYVVLTRGG